MTYALNRRFRQARCLAAAALFLGLPLRAQESAAVADVVVIVDNSVSMRDPGMDPERTSLLVTKLLADIVPGELTAVRLLDLTADQADLPSRRTGVFRPCLDNPGNPCEMVEPAADWDASARTRLLGALSRERRADPTFKRELETHLEQRSNNSHFGLAFRTAQGVFERHQADGEGDGPARTIIWLSDGRSDDPDHARQAIVELAQGGVGVEAIVFGRGDDSLAKSAGLAPRRVSNPAEIMKAFAGAFRRIVQAPYEIDNLVAAQPDFEMKNNVEEAWIVVYGDQTLDLVELEPAGGQLIVADYAAESWPSAGAYKVAYLRRPAAGRYTVHARGGGAGVAYAVVQRSSLAPALLEPRRALSGAEVSLIAGVKIGAGDLLTDPALLSGLSFTATFQGKTFDLRDDGTAGDAIADDGRFSATVVFHGSEEVPVELHLKGDVVDRKASAEVDVMGEFRYDGGPVEIDLGQLGVAAESCKPIAIAAHQEGEVEFELALERNLPADHQLELRMAGGGGLTPGDPPRLIGPVANFLICLKTSGRAPSSRAVGEPWLTLQVAGSALPTHRVMFHLRWEVTGLSFWQRWGWLILVILGLLLLAAIIAGFVLPHRFSGSFAVVFVPERGELDETTPQPVKQWRGTGIGFYRHARAYLHGDYRLSGNASGALAGFFAESGAVRLEPGRGAPVLRETLDGDWEALPAEGKRVRAGDIFRIGDRGPYFRIAIHRAPR